MARTLILGAGFGGIAVATELHRLRGANHEVILLDRTERFVMGLRKLWDLVGHATLAEGSRSRELLAERGIRFLPREIQAIDPQARRVTTDRETFDADYLVIALGAEPRPDLVEGLAEYGHNVWAVAGVPAAREALAEFAGGRIAIVIAGAPYPCPPAPYECAMLLDEHLRARGLRDQSTLTVTTMQPMLLPNAGPAGSSWIGEQLAERGITFQVGRKVERVEPGRVVFTDGELDFDLLIGVPPHRPPRVIRDSGLLTGADWITVDPATLATSSPKVFAIGDVTQIPLANGLMLPKAGVFAEREGMQVAATIVADLYSNAPPAPFDGQGYCFIETNSATAALVEGNFFAQPEPQVSVLEATSLHAEHKRRFERERLERWFGY